MLQFPCDRCGRRLRVAEAHAGRRVRCPGCGQVVPVPITASVVSAPAAPDAKRATEALTGSSQPSTGDFVPPELYDFLSPAEGPGELGRLGGYRVLKVLGAGGMGVVFEAEDLRLKRPVALKAMLPTVAASPTNRQRFLLEAQAAAAIEHDHIVTIYQVGEDRNIPFIAMQLLKGESLEDRLAHQGALGPAEALHITRQIASGLAVAHDRGLIHRDIKPSNIWLERKDEGGRRKDEPNPSRSSFRVRILDFGLARPMESDTHLTRDGAIVGTPAYLSPEQCRHEKLDGRCDLFSLGCVLYRMGTGRLPFKGTDTLTTLLSLARDDPPPPQQLNPQLPAGLSRLILDLLAKDPNQRPSSARALIQRIEGLERSLPQGQALAASPLPAGAVARAPVRMPTRAEVDRTDFLRPTAQGGKTKWLLLALGLAGGAFLLVVGVVGLGVVVWLNRPGAASREAAATTARTAGPTQPAAGNDGHPLVQDEPDGPPPPPAPPPDADVFTVARHAAQTKNYTQTEALGFPLHPAFEEVPPEGALLIGFEITLGKFIQDDVIDSLRPIFLTAKGEVRGQTHGQPSDRLITVKARQGYAVGAVAVTRHLRIDGLKITFMRVEKKGLDPDQSYQSPNIARIGGMYGPGQTVTGHGALIIGICGKSDGRVCDALGLVLRGKVRR
jgi:hypothetical protein